MKEKTGVCKVDITWDDEALKVFPEYSFVPKEEAPSEFLGVFPDSLGKFETIVDQGVRSQRFRSQQGPQLIGFTVSRVWLNKSFGKEAEQMPSSTSIVVMINDKL